MMHIKHYICKYFLTDQYPESCETECRCYSNWHDRALVADCSNSGLTKIPISLPDDLDWLLLSGNNISFLFAEASNHNTLKHISKLILQNNIIINISENILDIFANNSKLSFLDISSNNLKFLPKSIRNISSLAKLKIQKNMFQCSCDNTWMRNWLLNNSKIIENYKEIKCQMNGAKWIPIIQMNEVNMECLPNGSFAVWKIAGQLFTIKTK